MELTVGAIVVGKVTSITKFGAFVALDEGKTGLVHISEVSQSFVSDIRDHLTEGQEVKVKIIAVDENGRINLSIKRTQPREAVNNTAGRSAQRRPRGGASRSGGLSQKKSEEPTELSFEDKLKHFMQDSESRMSDIRHNMDRKSGSRRRR